MPVGPYKDFDACLAAMKRRYADDATARKVCGKMEKMTKLERNICPARYESILLERGLSREKAKKAAKEVYEFVLEQIHYLEACRGPGDADRPSGDFAIPRLRALPYRRGKRVQLNCVRAALARLNQVKGATKAEKASARRKLESILRESGGEPGDALKKKYP